MPNEAFLITGGVVIAAAVIAFLVIRSKNGKTDITQTADDHLVVSELSASNITSWFKEKNPNGKYTNIVMLANNETFSKMNVSAEIRESCNMLLGEAKNVVLQATFDDENDAVVMTRAIAFETMSEKLQKLFTENNGIIILE